MAASTHPPRTLRLFGAGWNQVFGLSAVILMPSLYVAVLLNTRHADRAGTIVVLVLAAVFLPLILLAALKLLRPVVVTRQALRIPKIIRNTEIPIAEVTGIGLTYPALPTTPSRGVVGWSLTIWDSAGRRHTLDKFVVPVRSDRGPDGELVARGVPRPPGLPLPKEDTDVLAVSRAGRAATRLAAYISEAQGPDGAFATEQTQKHSGPAPRSRWSSPGPIAWWSADRTMGRYASAQDPHAGAEGTAV